MGSDTICIGEESSVTIQFTGVPYAVDLIEDAGGVINTISITDVVSNSYTCAGSPTVNASYSS